MEVKEILQYFADNWDRIEKHAQKEGLPQGFYPIILPEIDDHRFTASHLPAIKYQMGIARTRISNPSVDNFRGIIIKEQPEERIEEDITVVRITYLERDKVYEIQCVEEVRDPLTRRFAVSIPQTIVPPQPELQKVYMELEALLQ